ncbi:hypothetical protein ABK040_013422 [Willaertia magna]
MPSINEENQLLLVEYNNKVKQEHRKHSLIHLTSRLSINDYVKQQNSDLNKNCMIYEDLLSQIPFEQFPLILFFNIKNCKQLKVKDLLGLSDPWVKILVYEKEDVPVNVNTSTTNGIRVMDINESRLDLGNPYFIANTRVIEQCLDPFFNEQFIVFFPKEYEHQVIELQVWDKDKYTKDDKHGYCRVVINYNQISKDKIGNEFEFNNITLFEKKDDHCGTISFSVRVFDSKKKKEKLMKELIEKKNDKFEIMENKIPTNNNSPNGDESMKKKRSSSSLSGHNLHIKKLKSKLDFLQILFPESLIVKYEETDERICDSILGMYQFFTGKHDQIEQTIIDKVLIESTINDKSLVSTANYIFNDLTSDKTNVTYQYIVIEPMSAFLTKGKFTAIRFCVERKSLDEASKSTIRYYVTVIDGTCGYKYVISYLTSLVGGKSSSQQQLLKAAEPTSLNVYNEIINDIEPIHPIHDSDTIWLKHTEGIFQIEYPSMFIPEIKDNEFILRSYLEHLFNKQKHKQKELLKEATLSDHLSISSFSLSQKVHYEGNNSLFDRFIEERVQSCDDVKRIDVSHFKTLKDCEIYLTQKKPKERKLSIAKYYYCDIYLVAG